MRRITFGVLSLVGAAAALVACGDDDGGTTPGNGGSGGRAGSGGNGNNAGNGGAAGNGTGGNAGNANGGNGGNGGAGPGPDLAPRGTCTGCVEIIVPVTGPNDGSPLVPVNVNDQASYIFTVAAPGADFSNGVATFRIQALETNANLNVSPFAQNGAPSYPGVYPAGLTFSATDLPLGQWVDLELNLAQYAPVAGAGDAGPPPADAGDAGALLPNNGFDKSAVAQYGITVGASAALVGSAVVRLLVDSVTITGSDQTSKTFDAGLEGFALNAYQVPAGTPTVPTHRPAP